MMIREYREEDLEAMIRIWNEVVTEGIAFPQEECLDLNSGEAFFASQSYAGVAEEEGTVLGLYILHPNNVGRCGHICNASYAVASEARGRHIGEKLVLDCLSRGKTLGFRVLPSAANFLFAAPPQPDAETVFRRLREEGVLVRYFKKPRIDGFLRISVGTDEEMDGLLAALGRI